MTQIQVYYHGTGVKMTTDRQKWAATIQIWAAALTWKIDGKYESSKISNNRFCLSDCGWQLLRFGWQLLDILTRLITERFSYVNVKH